MNLRNQPPIFVPAEYQSEIEKLSKAALMDLVWDFAITDCGGEDELIRTMEHLRERRDIILRYREQAKSQGNV